MENSANDTLESIRTSVPRSLVESGPEFFSSRLSRSTSAYAPEVVRRPSVPTPSDEPLLNEWMGYADPSLCRPELLHEIFESTVDRLRDKIAILCGTDEMTYSEVDDKANRLAHFLLARGVQEGDCVGMCLPRSSEVYIALLAILKTGAAYVPLDPDYPTDRVNYILSDCGVSVLITTTECLPKSDGFPGQVIVLDRDRDLIMTYRCSRLSREETGATPRSLSYVIYTSGSTGKPKGVQIEHQSACHLVRAEGRIYQVRQEDRVYQGFSITFDASVEEVWMAFFAGATLVVGTRELQRSGPALSTRLTELGVTVISCVPTLLSMLEDDMPSIRLLILGGEACRAELVDRWARPGRRLVNTYGPTEATVIATWVECEPGKPVTIGRPLPNYFVYILDEHRRRVPPGTPGELYLGGRGLARGYVGKESLTRERFIPNPFGNWTDAPLLYRTGDLVRFTLSGDIEFLGRVDSQVKIRGFRVELSEIETVLGACPQVLGCAVAVHESDGVQQLVAYVVPRKNIDFNENELLQGLRAQLPQFMVPSLLETLSELPTLPSGKIDRKSLPAPRDWTHIPDRKKATPRNAIESKVLEAWTSLFHPMPVGLTDDFFLDLGGHSLLAARMVSALRKDADFNDLSMLDVYNHPTVEKLAQASTLKITARSIEKGTEPESETQKREWLSLPQRHFLCGTAQMVGLYFVLGLFSLQWLAPYLTYSWLLDSGYGVNSALLASLGSLVAIYPVMLLFALAFKWLVIGRYRAGRYPLWGSYFFRWWLVDNVLATVPIGYLSGTPLLGWYYRLLGVKIGKNVHLDTDDLGAYDLITIGDDASIGSDTTISGSVVENGELVIGPVSIESRASIGVRAVLSPHTQVGESARLEDLSLLPAGASIPAHEIWRGSPAHHVPGAVRPSPRPRPSLSKRLTLGAAQALGVLAFPCFVIAAFIPGMLVMYHLSGLNTLTYYLVLPPFVALSFVVLLCLEITVMKWLLLGKVKPGTYAVHSAFYFKKWLVDQLLDLSLDVVGPLYSTIYLAPWYRTLGAKLGRRAEISTASFISPDLLTIEDEGFIADAVSLGAAHIEDGHFTLAETRIGKRSFIGNSALLPPGAVIGDNCLIGCLSTPPRDGTAAHAESSWLGSPPIFLPQREKVKGFSEEETFHPTRSLRAKRAVLEFFRVILPPTFFIILTSALLTVAVQLRAVMPLWKILLVFPFFYALAGLAAAGIVIAFKWALMGKYRACERPLWSSFVWRTELLTALHENLSDLFFTAILRGTPFLPWFFRLLGAQIGKRVYMDTTCLTEFDLVSIGDDVTLGRDSTVQTHLFEDRVMKMSHIRIGKGCAVGTLSLVLYDTEMEENTSLGALSLLMKRETLPARTRWHGIPARRV